METLEELVSSALQVVPPEDLGRVSRELIAGIRRDRFKIVATASAPTQPEQFTCGKHLVSFIPLSEVPPRSRRIRS